MGNADFVVLARLLYGFYYSRQEKSCTKWDIRSSSCNK